MPKINVKVKWGKEVYNDVEVDTDEPPLLLKAQLFALTGVQPERQKVCIKGQSLKDEEWPANLPLKNGTQILLMGSKEENIPKEPVEKIVFLEDMNEIELASALDLPAGLTNLGNTCYMNATLQCLKTVPELRGALKKYKGDVDSDVNQLITQSIRDVFNQMDTNGATISPILLLQVLHIALPRFAEKSEHGGYCQQDANECWTEIIRILQQKIPAIVASDGKPQKDTFRSLIDQYFGGKYEVEYKCLESEIEEPTKTIEDFLQISCFISQEVRYMINGLKSKMQEKITKFSPTLQRDADYQKTSKIKRLPAYLTIQFVRFFYKEKGSINAKILKDVKFPLDFDAYELCTPELQEKLLPVRNKYKEYEDTIIEKSGDLKSFEKPENIKKRVRIDSCSFEDDLGSNNSGFYSLQAVLTHQGRSSSSGHYVAWVRQTPTSEFWIKCDDNNVTSVSFEDILKLSGGGDWHCAYVLLYGPKVLDIPLETKKAE